MKYLDAHCHLMPDAAMDAAREVGVVGFVVNSARPDDWDAVAHLAARRRDVFGAIGVHPWYADGVGDDWAQTLRDMLTANPKLMVGETGLDGTHRSTLSAQVRLFREHLQIAHDLNRVVHVHCVGAWGHLLDVLRDAPCVPGLVLHRFSAHAQIAAQLEKYGAYFSYGNRRTYKFGAIDTVPVDRILIESDAPYGGDSVALPTGIEIVAELRGMDTAEMAELVYNNTLGMLNNGQI